MPRKITKDNASDLANKSHSKKAEAKRKATIKAKQEVRNVQALTDNLVKNALFDINPKTNHTYAEDFILGVRNAALMNPNGKAGLLLASMLMSPETIERMDKESEKIIARDIAFARYRLSSTLFKEQKQVIDDKLSRRISEICSRRAGKTELNARILIDASLEPNSPCAYIHLTKTNAIAQLFDLCLNAAEIAGLQIANGKDRRGNKNDGVIEFVNGSSIRFGGNSNKDEEEKIRGYKYRCVIIDEGQSQRNLRYLVEEVIQPLLFDYADSRLIITGTPPRVPHTYFEKCFRSKEFTPYHWDMTVNPFIPNAQKELEDLCRRKGVTMDSPFIKREYLGLIEYDTEALVFKNYKTYSTLPDDFIPTHIYIGVDFGFSDYNAVITFIADNARRIGYVTEERKFNKATVSEIVDNIRGAVQNAKDFCIKRNHGFDLNNCGIYCDVNEKSIVYELAMSHQLPAYCAYKYDKNMAMAQLADWARAGALLVPAGGVLCDEFEQTVYKRDMETDAILPEIDDDIFHPDATDALLYLSRQWAFDLGEATEGDAKKVTD